MTNEEIKKILDGAAYKATHWSGYYDYLRSAKNGYMSYESEYDSWDYEYSCLSDTHRLSSLREILELRQEVERLQQHNAKLEQAIDVAVERLKSGSNSVITVYDLEAALND